MQEKTHNCVTQLENSLENINVINQTSYCVLLTRMRFPMKCAILVLVLMARLLFVIKIEVNMSSLIKNKSLLMPCND